MIIDAGERTFGFRRNGFFDYEPTFTISRVAEPPLVLGTGLNYLTRGMAIRVALTLEEQYSDGQFSVRGPRR